jgi:polyisoprenoid-binding protein YceI
MNTTTLTARGKAIETSTWTLDPAHSQAQFKVRHMMISNVTGEFKTLTGSLQYNPIDPSLSYVEAVIETRSVDTRDEGRDAHLRSADFFDSEVHPNMSFRSTKFEYMKEEHLRITGDLTIRGVTREVTFIVEGPAGEQKDPWGNVRTALSATTTINRKDFGLEWNAALEFGGVLVGDDVKISIEAQFIRQS